MSYVQPRAKAWSRLLTARPWMDREEGECAWPIGEGTELWSCCEPVARAPNGLRRAYCAVHWKVMWRPAPDALAAGRGQEGGR